MLRVGLTGGIACGKSAVAGMFASLGVHVSKSDEVAHGLMLPGGPVFQTIVDRFGLAILDANGVIDRRKLAELAFSGEHPRVEELNRLIHPAVREQQERWCEEVRQRDPAGIAMIEAALILETGRGNFFHRLLVVVCRPEQKVERLAARLGMELSAAGREVERRSRAQWPDEDKARQADYILDNSGTLAETVQQVERVYRQLKFEAERQP